jgi:putative acetyltransferase
MYQIEKGGLQHLSNLQELFVGTIQEVTREDYNAEQRREWAATVKNKERWEKMLLEQEVLLAVKDGDLAGFATLRDGNYIDFFYVHQAHQRQGVAALLYNALEERARKNGASMLHSDISKTARGFFEKQGFTVIKAQEVERNGVSLTNFKMQKLL